jgi:hypothetical protein
LISLTIKGGWAFNEYGVKNRKDTEEVKAFKGNQIPTNWFDISDLQFTNPAY